MVEPAAGILTVLALADRLCYLGRLGGAVGAPEMSLAIRRGVVCCLVLQCLTLCSFKFEVTA